MLELCNVKISSDLSYIYQVMCNYEQQCLFSKSQTIRFFEDFERIFIDELRSFYHLFKVVKNEKKEIIGFVYSYNYRETDGHCSIVTYVDERYQATGAGIEASMMFIKMLFKQYPLRKIYTQVYEYNEQSLICNQKAGFQEEGCYKEYRFHNGEYWDMHILSMTRDAFLCKYERYLYDK